MRARNESECTYANQYARVKNRGMYNWAHPMSDVVNALIGAGLTIRELGEYPFSVDGTQMAFMEPGEDGYSRLPGYDLPLMYSIKATR